MTITDVPIVSEVKQYMLQCILAGDCTDSAGVLSPTQLAEAACDEFGAFDENDDIPELFFEWAYEVANEAEPAIEDDYEWIRMGC